MSRSNEQGPNDQGRVLPIVVWFGRFSGFGGLTDAAFSYVDACRAANLKVVMVDTISSSVVGPYPSYIEVKKKGEGVTVRALRADLQFVFVFHDTPGMMRSIEFDGAVRPVSFVVNETEEFPSDWALKLMDSFEVWVASEWNAANLREVIPPYMVKTLPHPLPDALQGFPMTSPRQQVLTFGTMASRLDRRRVGQLIRCFQTARQDGAIPENSRLIIKTDKGQEAKIQACADSARLNSLADIDMLDGVEFLNSRFTRQDVWEWFGTIDAIVSTEWGKGWDLPAFYALALGKVAISSKFGGNMEFMDGENAILLDYYLDYPDRSEVGNAQLYGGHRGGFVRDPDFVAGLEEASKRVEAGVDTAAVKRLRQEFAALKIGRNLRDFISSYEVFDFYGNQSAVLNVRPIRQKKAPALDIQKKAPALDIRNDALLSSHSRVTTGPSPAEERPLVHFFAKSLHKNKRLFNVAQRTYRFAAGRKGPA